MRHHGGNQPPPALVHRALPLAAADVECTVEIVVAEQLGHDGVAKVLRPKNVVEESRLLQRRQRNNLVRADEPADRLAEHVFGPYIAYMLRLVEPDAVHIEPAVIVKKYLSG